eukprot:3710958-Pyramimonas_sp.AAC.1
MDLCTTGRRDSHRALIRTPKEIMANRRLSLTPFENRRCMGHHQHASVCNRDLAKAQPRAPRRCNSSPLKQFKLHTTWSQ